jgi:hypothetical protein
VEVVAAQEEFPQLDALRYSDERFTDRYKAIRWQVVLFVKREQFLQIHITHQILLLP